MGSGVSYFYPRLCGVLTRWWPPPPSGQQQQLSFHKSVTAARFSHLVQSSCKPSNIHPLLYLPANYRRGRNVTVLFGFDSVYRIARSQNKRRGRVTNMAPFLSCKSALLVISNKWHFQLRVPGLPCVCAHASFWTAPLFCNTSPRRVDALTESRRLHTFHDETVLPAAPETRMNPVVVVGGAGAAPRSATLPTK